MPVKTLPAADWREVSIEDLGERGDIPLEERSFFVAILRRGRGKVTLWDTPHGLIFKGIGLLPTAEQRRQ